MGRVPQNVAACILEVVEAEQFAEETVRCGFDEPPGPTDHLTCAGSSQPVPRVPSCSLKARHQSLSPKQVSHVLASWGGKDRHFQLRGCCRAGISNRIVLVAWDSDLV